MRVILERARAELLPVTAMRIVPLLAAYTAKQREGVRSVQRMQAQRAMLDRARLLAAGAANKVCNTPEVSKASAVPSGAAETLAFATSRLLGPTGSARSALHGMARFVDTAELQRCMADRGCSDSQVAMTLTASRAAGATSGSSMRMAGLASRQTAPFPASSQERFAVTSEAKRSYAKTGRVRQWHDIDDVVPLIFWTINWIQNRVYPL